jgi:hypothetical protein
MIPLSPKIYYVNIFNKPKWEYNKDQEAWLFGTNLVGCGVYQNDDGEWEGNVVLHNNITHLGPYQKKRKAQRVAVDLLRKQFNNQ